MPIVSAFNKIFNDFDMSQDGYSTAFDLEAVTGYTIHAYWSGTPTGILFLQVSSEPVATNWNLIDLSLVNTEGVANTHLWKHALASYRWVRLGYAFSSGSGTLNAYLKCKGIN